MVVIDLLEHHLHSYSVNAKRHFCIKVDDSGVDIQCDFGLMRVKDYETLL